MIWNSFVVSKNRALVSLSVAAVILAASLPTSAASRGLKTMPGHVPPATAKLAPKGRLAGTNRLNLAIGLLPRDEPGFSNFLARVYDPASANFHHYLSPEEFAARFGPTEADYAAVRRFAETNGLAIANTHANRLLLDVSGAAEDIQRAFNITLLTYQHPTEARDFYAPDTEPSVDATLRMADIGGLSDYGLPHPKSVRREPASAANALPKTGSASTGAYLGNDFRAAYLPGVSLTGAGQMVGLVQFDGFYASDIAAYQAAAGLNAVPIQTVLLDGYSGTPTTGTSSGNPEVSLDLEMVMSMAPGISKIIVFEAGPRGNQNDILNAMAASNQVKQFSCSWGWSGGPSTTTDNIFKLMAAQGQSFFSASGDSDAFTIGSSSANGVDNPSLQNAPASSPYITQVGGTTLTTTGAGGAWASETAWNWGLHSGSYVGTSGGISSYYSIPSWQAGVSMSANGGSTAYRNIPDVALTADNVYVRYGSGLTGTFGGTSCAAPLWAGLAALINQQATGAGRPTVGLINSAVYALGASNLYSSAFHDITTGNNVSSASPANYYAVAGYDLCTGWGTPSGQALIDALAGKADALTLSPATGFAASGPVGGPFGVGSGSLLLTNTGSSSLAWALNNAAAWLQSSAASGTLAGGASTLLTVSLTPAATTLAAGSYSATLSVTNLNSLVVHNLVFTLQIGQTLVQNGGFETGSFSPWTLVGNTVIYRNIYNAVESSSGSPLAVHSGNYGAFLGDVQLATLSQTLTTVPGQSYLLSLWLDNPTSGGTQEFLVRWNTNSSAVNTLYSLISPPAFAWTNLQFLVTATATNTVLQFAAENDVNFFGLDDVSVIPIPNVAFQSAAKATNNFKLAWTAATGVVYQVQYKTNLLQPAWVNLGAPILATSRNLAVSDTNATGSSPQRFYRLIAAP